jgi:hypothetical protein
VEPDRVEVLEVVGREDQELEVAGGPEVGEEQVLAQAAAGDPGREVQELEVAGGRAGEDRVADAVREAGEQAGPEGAERVPV